MLLGIKEISLAVPRLSALQKLWIRFGSSTDRELTQDEFVAEIERVSCQMLYFAAYFHLISEFLGSPDLSLMSQQLSRECCKIFPRIEGISSELNSPVGGDPTSESHAAVHSRGRRLALRASSLVWCGEAKKKGPKDADEQAIIEELIVPTDGLTADIIEEVSLFAKQEIDKDAILDVLCGDVAACYNDARNTYLSNGMHTSSSL